MITGTTGLVNIVRVPKLGTIMRRCWPMLAETLNISITYTLTHIVYRYMVAPYGQLPRTGSGSPFRS